MAKYTFDNHSRSIEAAIKVCQEIVGDALTDVAHIGSIAARVCVTTSKPLTSDQSNSIVKRLAELPRVQAVADTPTATNAPITTEVPPEVKPADVPKVAAPAVIGNTTTVPPVIKTGN